MTIGPACCRPSLATSQGRCFNEDMLPLAISLGDPAGIGPEVTLKALQTLGLARPVVLYGDENVIAATAELVGFTLPLTWGLPPSDAVDGVYVVSLTQLSARAQHSSSGDEAAAQSTLAHLTAAVDAVREQHAAALVTAPIHKERLSTIGFEHPGHTEFLAARTGANRFAMMLAGERMRVTLVTIHCRLSEVATRLSSAGIHEKIVLTHDALQRWFGIAKPRIAVLGLNPHAGEGGLFGDEEARLIVPAIARARAEALSVDGPFPADGFFGRYEEAGYDAVVCMYHDQGLIPLKMMHFWDGVNVTLGLPIIRTSPDHGTAFDIAGRNQADARSMAQAIKWAHRFASR